MCGIFAVYNVPNGFNTVFGGLRKIQHRGKEGAGIVVSNGDIFLNPSPHKTLGMVGDLENAWPYEIPKDIYIGVGHVRYGTRGKKADISNVQPFIDNTKDKTPFCVAHNGEIPKYEYYKKELLKENVRFTSTSDTEVILRTIAKNTAEKSFKDALLSSLNSIEGAYSLAIATPDTLFACRDPLGYRPLHLAKLGNGYVISSETCSFITLGAKYMRQINPGEVLMIDKRGRQSFYLDKKYSITQNCSFCPTYFSHPTSRPFERETSLIQEELGRKVAKEFGAPKYENSIIVEVPDSAKFFTVGYAKAVGLCPTLGLLRAHSTGRTFITPGSKKRKKEVRYKFDIVSRNIKDKWVYLCDDSIVRGNTMKRLVRLLQKFGARGVTVLVSSPQVLYPCHMGIDMKRKNDFIARKFNGNIEKIREFFGADELYYISLKGFQEIIGDPNINCYSCFDKNYALEIPSSCEF